MAQLRPQLPYMNFYRFCQLLEKNHPKAPIIGLVIMPHGALMEIAPALGLFCLLVAGAGTSFLVLGSLVGRAPVLSPRIVYRVAAFFLVVFSIGLAGSASGLI